MEIDIQMLHEQTDIYLKKGNCALEDCKYQTVIDNYVQAIKTSEFYIRHLPHYQLVLDRASYHAFIAQNYAIIALSYWFLGNMERALESINTALNLMPESLFVMIHFLITSNKQLDTFLSTDSQFQFLKQNIQVNSSILLAINSVKALETGKVQLAYDYIAESFEYYVHSQLNDKHIQQSILIAFLMLCNKTSQLLVELPITMQVNIQDLFGQLFQPIPSKIAEANKIFKPAELAQLCFIVLESFSSDPIGLLQINRNLQQYILFSVPLMKQMRSDSLDHFLKSKNSIFTDHIINQLAHTIDGFHSRLRKAGIILDFDPLIILPESLNHYVAFCCQKLQHKRTQNPTQILFSHQKEFEQQTLQNEQIVKIRQPSHILKSSSYFEMIGSHHPKNQIVKLNQRKEQQSLYEQSQHSKIFVNPNLVRDSDFESNALVKQQLLTNDPHCFQGKVPNQGQANYKQRETLQQYAQPVIPARFVKHTDVMKIQQLYSSKQDEDMSKLILKEKSIQQLLIQYELKYEKVPLHMRKGHTLDRKIQQLNHDLKSIQDQISDCQRKYDDPLLSSYRNFLSHSKLLQTEDYGFEKVRGIKDLYDNRLLTAKDFELCEYDAQSLDCQKNGNKHVIGQELEEKEEVFQQRPLTLKIPENTNVVKILQFSNKENILESSSDEHEDINGQSSVNERSFVRPRTRYEDEIAKLQQSNFSFFKHSKDDIVYQEQVQKIKEMRSRRVNYLSDKKYSDQKFFRTRATGFIFSVK